MTSADEEIEEKLNKIFTQLPTCPDTCDLDDTYLNKLLDYLDSRGKWY